ncbi:MAG: squalene/phytoene synthase family protein [Gammaproteobacteria bacterium]|nr:squalene/phytoene synthase family protein [Gammaproteobacteria bacterium]
MSSAITPREGSTFYYGLLKTASQQRSDVCALLQFCEVLASVLHEVTEPAVAEQKIHWWHQEIERLQTGDSRHPAATIVYPAVGRYALNPEHFLSILQANNNEKYLNAADEDSFQQRLQIDYGARLALCTAVLTETNSDTPTTWTPVPEWAGAFGTFERLRQLAYLHHRAYPVLPDSDYRGASLEPANLLNTDTDSVQVVDGLLKARIERAMAQFTTALQQPLPDERIIPVYLCARMRLAQLNQWQSKPSALLRQYTSLTPIRKLWICWRMRRHLQSVRQFS